MPVIRVQFWPLSDSSPTLLSIRPTFPYNLQKKNNSCSYSCPILVTIGVQFNFAVNATIILGWQYWVQRILVERIVYFLFSILITTVAQSESRPILVLIWIMFWGLYVLKIICATSLYVFDSSSLLDLGTFRHWSNFGVIANSFECLRVDNIWCN